MERHNVATLPRVALERQVALCPGGKKRRILDGFSFERRNTVSRSMPAEQGEPSPYNHHLQEFLTFLKQERSFADATIVNRK
jgi:hypothetical protein